MANFDDLDEQVLCSPVGRKRKLNPENHARNKAKKARYSGAGENTSIRRTHNRPRPIEGFCVATILTDEDEDPCHFR